MTPKFTTKIILAIVIVGLVVFILLWGPAACQNMRSQGAQSKVDQAQIGALENSSANAVATQSKRNQEERASEDTGRTNQEDIRHAEASGNDAAVTDAGFRSLCKRASFRATESGKVHCTSAP